MKWKKEKRNITLWFYNETEFMRFLCKFSFGENSGICFECENVTRKVDVWFCGGRCRYWAWVYINRFYGFSIMGAKMLENLDINFLIFRALHYLSIHFCFSKIILEIKFPRHKVLIFLISSLVVLRHRP